MLRSLLPDRLSSPTIVIQWLINGLILLEMAPRCTASGGCADGWTQNNNNCYYVARSKVTWQEAETRCRQMKANLTSVLDDDENNFINTIIDLSNADYWIGLWRANASHSWVWTDGSKMSYVNWSDNDHPQTSGNCVMINERSQWSVTACSTDVSKANRPVSYICKQAATKYPPTDKNDGSRRSATTERQGLKLVLPLVLSAVSIVLVITVDIVAIYYCKRIKCARITSPAPE